MGWKIIKLNQYLENHPERLLELDGIGPKRQARVTSAWAEQKVIREITDIHLHRTPTSKVP